MEAKEFHPLVELLLARMKSHPEEFEGDMSSGLYSDRNLPTGLRWAQVISHMKDYLTPEEEVAVTAALRVIRMDSIHRHAMDELLNGEERRRKEREEEERWQQMVHKQSMGASGTLTHQQMANSAFQPLMHDQLSGLATATGVAHSPAQTTLGGLVNQIKRKIK